MNNPAHVDLKGSTGEVLTATPGMEGTGGGLGHRSGAYLLAGLLSTVAALVATQAWRLDWSVPVDWNEDSISSAGHFQTVIETGWYEFQPRLGWPYGQRYHDYPASEDLNQLIIRLLGTVSDSWVWVFNTYFYLSFPATAMAALYFFRYCKIRPALSIALSILYSLAPYHFFRGARHMFLSQYWMVPLAMCVVLAVLRGTPIWTRRLNVPTRLPLRGVVSFCTGRGAGTAIVLTLTTLSSSYYGVFTGVLIAAAGALSWFVQRDWKRTFGAVCAVATVGLALLVGLLPDWMYSQRFGPNPGALVRNDRSAEHFALTLPELLLPSAGHRLTALDDLRDSFDASYPFGWGEKPSLGLIAALGLVCCFLVLSARLFGRARSAGVEDDDRYGLLGDLSSLAVTAVMLASVGGIGSFIALLAGGTVRGWNRMSIFIMLPALAVVGILLHFGIKRINSVRRPRTARLFAATSLVTLLLVGLVDQTTSYATRDYEAIAETFASERDFVSTIETLLPDDASVFQYPYIEWPEGPHMSRMHSNDQLKLYLHSSTINWSGGGIKGRPQIEWQKAVTATDTSTMVTSLAIIGFSGIVVDTWALEDDGQEFEAGLSALLGAAVTKTRGGRFSYFDLSPIAAEVDAGISTADRSAQADRLTNGAFSAPRP